MNAREAYLERHDLLAKVQGDPLLEEIEREKCRRDVNHFVDRWCFTFDPRNHPKHLPFALYDFQIEALKWLSARYKNKENGLIEKSRDMGCTWLVSAWAVHAWLFDIGFTCLFGSRKEDLVDNGMLDSIFGKLRYLVYRLPIFLRPPITERTKTDRFLTLLNPLNGNEIVGESANIGFGRGGRSSICILDEAAHIHHSESIHASVSENTDCLIYLSTPNGKDNQFAYLRHETKIPTLSLHWSLHPLKSQDWYNKRKEQMKPWQVAQELDLSYERSLEGRIYSRFDRQYNVPRVNIQCNLEFEQFITYDFGIADPMALVFGQISADDTIEIWNYLELTNKDIDFFMPIIRGFKPNEYEILTHDEKKAVDRCLAKIPLKYTADHYGDHAGTARTANSKRSCRDTMKEHGIKLITSGKQTFDWRIECFDNLLKLKLNSTRNEWYSIFQVSPDCDRVIDCLFNYVWDSENISDDKIKPKHNWSSHIVTALEFFAINRFPIRKSGGARVEQIR